MTAPASPRRLLRPVGWLVAIGGSLGAIAAFWIDHMSAALWGLMLAGILVSVAAGALLVRLSRGKKKGGDPGGSPP